METGIPLEEEFHLPETHVPAAWRYHQVVKLGDGIAIFHRDITKRKRAEEALRDSEEQFRAMFEKHRAVMLLIDPENGKIIHSNKSAEIYYGYTAREIENLTIQQINQLHKEKIISEMANAKAQKRNYFHFTHKLATGEVRYVEVHSSPIPFKGKTILFSIISDITDRKRAEDNLRESEEKFRLITENMGDVIWLLSADNMEMLYVSPSYEQVWGRTCRSLYDAPQSFMESVHPDDLEEVHAAFEKYLHGGRFDLEYRIQRPDGDLRWVHARSFPIRNQNGQIIRHAGIANDITKKKKYEAALAIAKNQAEAANQAKSEFLANMSHELRTPFNGIMGMMQLLQTTPLSLEQQEYVNLAIKSSERFTRLLSDILELSSIEAGRMVFFPARFALGEVLESISGLFTATAREKGVALECCMAPDLPAHVVGDAVRVKQILFNLVGNALKFTKKGTVQVHLNALSAAKSGDARIMFSISDTGIGIPDDKFKDLFQPFSQVEGSYTRSYQGAGLGLVIVRRLVGLMNGNIDVESEVGQGTTVHVVLPFALPTRDVSETAHATPASKEARKGLNILLAEDDPLNQICMTAMLKKLGHAVTLANNGQEALDLLERIDFDCILMDIQMPVMTGDEATKRIRSQESGIRSQVSESREISSELHPSTFNLQRPWRIPIIAVTAHAQPGDREKFLETGMDGYLAKPVRMEDLQKVLERVVVNEKA